MDPDGVKACEQGADSRQVPGTSLLDGSWLQDVARENLNLVMQMAPHRKPCGVATLTWGSMCSGSEGPAWVIAALNQLFEMESVDFKLEHVFSCEANAEKRKWIHATASLAEPALRSLACERCGEPLPELDLQSLLQAAEAPCVFNDILDMCAAQAECWEHGPGKCHVRSVDLLIVGTSCKDMSRANPGSVRQETVLKATESKGGSAQTFRGLMNYVERHRPLMILFENVDAMEDMILFMFV